MKKALLIMLILLVLAAIPITLLVVKQRQDTRQRAEAQTSLFFEPATVTKTVGDPDTFTLNLMIETGSIAGGNLVDSIDLWIDYNPTYLELVSMQNGSFFCATCILLEPVINPAQGTANMAFGEGGGISTNGGSEILASLTFKVKDQATSATQVVIDHETDIDEETSKAQAYVTENDYKDVIVGVDSASITINAAGGASPTPTPAASATPGPSPTPGGPTPTPAPSPSATPAASPNQYVFITSPVNGTTVTVKKPTIAGTAYPNGLVVLSLTLNSSPVLSSSLYANASGSWSYVPTQDLANGTYTVTATGSDSSNQNSEAATSIFTVSVDTGGTNIASPTPAASPSPGSASPPPGSGTDTTKGGVPVTGTPLPTYTIVGLATLFLILSLGAIFLPK